MKKSIMFIIVALMMATTANLAFAQKTTTVVPSSNLITKVLDISDFNAIRIVGASNVYYTQNAEVKASIQCPDNILEHLDITVSKNILTITLKKGVNIKGSKDNTTGGVLVTASSPVLNDITISGVGSVEIANDLTSDANMSLTMSGVGAIICKNVTAPRLTMSVSGVGSISCDRIDSPDVRATVSGIGSITSDNVNSTSIVTNVKGLGSIDLKEIKSDKVKANVRGEGVIELDGATRLADYFISSAGTIEADRLMAEDVVAIADGPGVIKCFATQVLDAKASEFVGGIQYKGNPKIKDNGQNPGSVINSNPNDGTFNLPIIN